MYPFVIWVFGCLLRPPFRLWSEFGTVGRFRLDIVFVSVVDGTLVVPVFGIWMLYGIWRFRLVPLLSRVMGFVCFMRLEAFAT